MVLALVFERQKKSLVTEQRLRSALTSFMLMAAQPLFGN
jgi:hypothetical protein